MKLNRTRPFPMTVTELRENKKMRPWGQFSIGFKLVGYPRISCCHDTSMTNEVLKKMNWMFDFAFCCWFKFY